MATKKTTPKKSPTAKKPTKSKTRSNSTPLNLTSPFSKRLGLIFALVFCLIGGYLIYSSSQAATAEVSFASGLSGKCMDVYKNATTSGSKVNVWSCNNTPAQHWTVNADGTLQASKGMCLDNAGNKNVNGNKLMIFRCSATDPAEQWRHQADKTFRNPATGKCIQAPSSTNGDQLVLYTCKAGANQTWTTKTTVVVKTPTPAPGNSGGSNPSGQAMPKGDIAGWHQIFADDFSGTVPKGAFSDCNHNTDSPSAYCGGLKNYGAYYTNWWAYPNGWGDTAKTGADGNGGAPYGGVYHPEDTVSVANGVMSVRMYRPSSGGDNHVAAVVPRKCMAHKYGRYTERFKVVHADAGFKSAHLFYDGGYEIDYPENDYGDTIYAYTHPGEASFSSGAKYTSWHTTTIEWTSKSTKFYMDGKLIGTTSNRNPNIAMSWVLQNESSIMGPYAKNGAYAQLDTDWVACYSPA